MAESVHSVLATSTVTSSPSHSQASKEGSSPRSSRPFSKSFLQAGDPELITARAIYVKTYIAGLFMVILTVFAVFPIYWGSLWKVPAHPLPGWIVDFDGGDVGFAVVQQLTATPNKFVKWTILPASHFPDGQVQVAAAVVDQKTWVAVTISNGASDRLASSIVSPNASYNGLEAITMYGVEARNENAYRTYLRPYIQTSLNAFQDDYAIQQAVNLSTATNLPSLLSVSPQTVTVPVSYTIVNILPFNQPVASAVTFVGLIYQLILSFFVVVIAHGAREASRLNRILQCSSLVLVRLTSSFFGYFFLSLFYSLLSLAFKINLTARWGNAGFMVFWMVNWVGMLAVGLALESLITLLTPRFIPFFMLLLIISNVAVCVFPIDILPRIYHYGYGAPFFNVSQAVRAIVFGTKNKLGQNFGVLFIWITFAIIALVLIQWYVRRKDVAEEKNQRSKMRTDNDQSA